MQSNERTESDTLTTTIASTNWSLLVAAIPLSAALNCCAARGCVFAQTMRPPDDTTAQYHLHDTEGHSPSQHLLSNSVDAF